MNRASPWLAVLVSLALAAEVRAEEPPTIDLPHLPGAAIRLDGVLDEEHWQRAHRIDEFWNFDPVDQGRSEFPTTAWIFHDGEHLYFAFDCPSPDEARVRAHLGAREDINRDDQVGIYLDTFDDDRRGFVLYVNALGVQQDIRVGEDTGWNFDWDARFRSAARIDDHGYKVEVAVPFESLRFPRGAEQRFGLVLTRKLASRNVKIAYPHVEQGPSLWAQAATLTGIHDVAPGRPLEIIPSATFSATWERDDGAGTLGLEHPIDLSNLHRGLTMRWAMSPNTSLGVAVNPDFSQVESDPDQLDVNTRYALFLDEKRPFFMQGLDAFDVPLDVLYTRSIVSPLEGINLNGVENGWTVGVLHAVDQAPAGSLVAEYATPGFEDDDVRDRLGVTNVLRVKRDVGRQAAVGLFVADKELGQGLPEAPDAYNRVGGLDAYVPIGKRVRIQGQALYSMTGQREGERIHGGAYNLSASVRDSHGEVWLEHQNIGRDFRSESGFVTRVDRIDTELGGEYRFDVDRGALTDIKPWAEAGVGFTHDGTFADQWADAAVRFKIARLNYLTFGATQWHELYASQRFTTAEGYLSFISSAIDVLRFSVSGNVAGEINYDPDDLFLGPSWEIEGDVLLRLLRRLSVEVTATHHAMFRPGGDPHYDIQIVRSGVLLSFTRDLWLRAVAEVNTHDQDLDLELLLGYTPVPGTAVYLGYSEGAAWAQRPFGTEHRTLFLKVQLLFMP